MGGITVKRKSSRRYSLLFLVFILLLVAYWQGERWLRQLLLYFSAAPWARSLVSSLGLAQQVAGRFVAGETVREAMMVTRELNGRGLRVTLDYLGESVTDRASAEAARDEIMHLLDCIRQEGLDANVSLKLSQLGVKIGQDFALQNMRLLLERAKRYNNRIRIDMEESALVDTTLDIYRTLRDEHGFDNVGVVIQAYLYRSEEDVRRLIDEGAWFRLCKGAYAEPPDIAFPNKADTDRNFIHLMQMLLSEGARKKGVYAGIATHDEKMIQATQAYAAAHNIPSYAYEFQMLYGIRRELQEDLNEQGYQVRVYVPYGTAWYPYFMRRLAERPANLWFFLSNLLRR
jgi:proline dehydrogenase